MVTQVKTLRVDKTKGKAAERMQQAVEELEYLVTFNRSICQAMQRTMQDLSEGVFISMANLTLARRDSYLEFIHGGVKPDTLTALRTAPVHLHSLFPDSLLVKAEEEISRSEERRSSGSSHQGWGQILEKGFKSKSKSFDIFQIQILSFSKGFKSNFTQEAQMFSTIRFLK